MNDSKALKELNEYALEMHGDASEFTEFHLAALKAAVAITECEPCDNDEILELVATNINKFGANKTCVQYGRNPLDNDNKYAAMFMQEYGLSITYHKNTSVWSAWNRSAMSFHENLSIAIFNALSTATAEFLDI